MVEGDLGEAEVSGAGTHECSKLGHISPVQGAWACLWKLKPVFSDCWPCSVKAPSLQL